MEIHATPEPRLLPHAAALLLGLFALGCSDYSPENDETGGDSELSLHDVCNGTYDCVPVRGERVITTLTFSWRANACYMQDVRVDDVNIPIDDVDVSITGTQESFRLCDTEGTACIDCYSIAPPTPGSARCSGTATSCSTIGASSCSLQSGCQYRVGANASSTSDDSCGGTARDCDEMTSQSNCEAQRGCSWQ